MDHPPEELRRGDVLLRRWRLDDAATVDRAVTESLDHLLPWMPWAAHHSRAMSVEFLEQAERDWAEGTSFNYAITHQGTTVVGSCGLMGRIGPGGLEIGYWLHHAWTGQGLATLAAATLRDQAFMLTGIDRVEIHHDEANTASAAIARRLEMTEVERRPREGGPQAPADVGVEVIWRQQRD